MSANKNKTELFGPFILITVGIVILFQNLGLLGANLWDTLVSLWPLLLIALGLNDLIRNRGIVGPTLTIGLGAAFLANTFGALDWGSWTSLLNLWPVLLIAVGLEIFIGRKSVWLSALGVAFSLSILVLGLWFSGGINGIAPRADTVPLRGEDIIQPLSDATDAEIQISSSVGSLYVESISDGENLVYGRVIPSRAESVEQSFKVNHGTAYYYLGSDLAANTNLRLLDYEQRKLIWDIGLSGEIPLALDISLGAGESILDLRGLTLNGLNLNLGIGQAQVILPDGAYRAEIAGGVGQTVITLPAEGQMQVYVSGGVGEIVIYAPRGLGLRISVDRGIAGVSVPSGYLQSENVYLSPDYADADYQIELHIEQGIGRIVVREE